jgi:two-component system, OmpR family, phosphate regulon sensor histidine kinase PhoR
MSTQWWIVVFTIAVAVVALSALQRAADRRLRRLRLLTRDASSGTSELPATFGSGEYQLTSQAIATNLQQLRGEIDQLRQERDQLSALLTSGTEGLLQISRAGRIVYMNDAAATLLGLPADARGQPIASLVRNAELRERLIGAASGTTQEPAEIALDDRQLFAICRALPNDGGGVAAIIDLTEVRRLEVVRRDFVANVSHELKTPLTSIRGYTETLMADDLPHDVRKQFLEVIQKNTLRIHRIVDDLLDLSRLQSGGWRPEIHEVDAAELAADVWTACAEAAHARSIGFQVAAGSRTLVAADAGGLRQVLSNLFDNALRYTPTGGRVTVLIEDVENGKRAQDAHREWIEIQVQDNGAGIPREALPRIFERFYRADPARSRAEGGTGLGLSIVKHLVESMHGEVSAESELGKGTTIRIRLPAA